MKETYGPKEFLKDRKILRHAERLGTYYRADARPLKAALMEYGYESLRGSAQPLMESNHVAQINRVFQRVATGARQNVREYTQWLMDRDSQHPLGWETLIDLEKALEYGKQDLVDADEERFAIVAENFDDQDPLIQCYTLIRNRHR